MSQLITQDKHTDLVPENQFHRFLWADWESHHSHRYTLIIYKWRRTSGLNQWQIPQGLSLLGKNKTNKLSCGVLLVWDDLTQTLMYYNDNSKARANRRPQRKRWQYVQWRLWHQHRIELDCSCISPHNVGLTWKKMPRPPTRPHAQ